MAVAAQPLLWLFLLLLLVSTAQSAGDARRGFGPGAINVTIRNDHPRRDSQGRILEVGDGSLLFHGGSFFLYGVKYQPCPVSQQKECYKPCGEYNMTFAVYSSPDLVSWTLVSANVMPVMAPDSGHKLSSRHVTYYEPGVVYNPNTRKFIMWFQMYFKSRACAVSDSPLGPFRIVTMPDQSGLGPLVNGSGVYLWVDQLTHVAYMKHNIILRGNQTGASQFVSQLSQNYTTVVKTVPVDWNCIPPAHSDPLGDNSQCFQEGGGLFQSPHDPSSWFVMGGNGCCFCAKGGDSKVWHSSTGPLGQYSYVGNANPPVSGVWWRNGTIDQYPPYTVAAQQFGVYPVPVLDTHGVETFQPLYIGLRWGSAPDGLKNHDYQFWYPLDVVQTAQGQASVAPMRNLSHFSLSLSTQGGHPR